MNTSCDVLVLGAGIAGLAAADALASRGFSVTVLEKSPGLGFGSSGNPAALISPHLSGDPLNAADRFHIACFEYARSFYGDLPDGVFRATGVVQMPSQRRLAALFERRALINQNIDYENATELANRSGALISRAGCFLRDAGVIDPIRVLEELCRRSTTRVHVEFGSDVVALADHETYWEAILRDDRRFFSQHVVIANSYQATQLSQTAWLPLEPIRGEVWLMSGRGDSPSRVPIAASSYFIPNLDQERILIGATYRHHDMSEDPDPDGWRNVLLRADGVSFAKEFCPVSSRVSFRTSTHDRLPYIGAVPDFDSALKVMRQKRSGSKLPESDPFRNLWISAGHGSRGFSSAPLAAVILADQIIDPERRSHYPIDPSRAVDRMLVAQQAR